MKLLHQQRFTLLMKMTDGVGFFERVDRQYKKPNIGKNFFFNKYILKNKTKKMKLIKKNLSQRFYFMKIIIDYNMSVFCLRLVNFRRSAITGSK